MAPCAPRAAAASVDRTPGVCASVDCTTTSGVRSLAPGVRTIGSVVRRAGVVWSRRTVHFGVVSPRS
jgi:hypothetical protein